MKTRNASSNVIPLLKTPAANNGGCFVSFFVRTFAKLNAIYDWLNNRHHASPVLILDARPHITKAMFPIEYKTKKANIEVFGLLNVENPEDWASLFKLDCYVGLPLQLLFHIRRKR